MTTPPNLVPYVPIQKAWRRFGIKLDEQTVSAWSSERDEPLNPYGSDESAKVKDVLSRFGGALPVVVLHSLLEDWYHDVEAGDTIFRAVTDEAGGFNFYRP